MLAFSFSLFLFVYDSLSGDIAVYSAWTKKLLRRSVQQVPTRRTYCQLLIAGDRPVLKSH